MFQVSLLKIDNFPATQVERYHLSSQVPYERVWYRYKYSSSAFVTSSVFMYLIPQKLVAL